MSHLSSSRPKTRRSDTSNSAHRASWQAAPWWRTSWLLLLPACALGFWALSAAPVAAQSSDADAGTCIGALLGIGLLVLFGVRFASRQRSQLSDLSQVISDASLATDKASQREAPSSSGSTSADAGGGLAGSTLESSQDLPPTITAMLAKRFSAIRWVENQNLPILEPGETLIFHTAVKPLIINKLKIESSNPQVNLKFDVNSRAYFTGTNRRLIISSYAARGITVSKGSDLFVPYGALSSYDRLVGARQRILCFQPGGSIEIEFGLPSEALLAQHCDVLDDAFATILAHYRPVETSRQP